MLASAFVLVHAPADTSTTIDFARPECSWKHELGALNPLGCLRPQLASRRTPSTAAEPRASVTACASARVERLFGSHSGSDGLVDSGEAHALAAALDDELNEYGTATCAMGKRTALEWCFVHATAGVAMDLAQTERFVRCRVQALPAPCVARACDA